MRVRRLNFKTNVIYSPRALPSGNATRGINHMTPSFRPITPITTKDNNSLNLKDIVMRAYKDTSGYQNG